MAVASVRDRLSSLIVDGVEETEKLLGKGSYGDVVEMKVKGLRCAGKKLHLVLQQYDDSTPSPLVDRFVEECINLGSLRHPNIVQLIGVSLPEEDNPVPTIIMELLPMSLSQCLEKYPTIPRYMKYSILLDVAVGLEYLHCQTPPIMHRDLTANNILLTSGMQAKISDLGQAKILQLSPHSTLTTNPGTACYMPPEALISVPSYTTMLDVFSYGVLIIHVVLHAWPIPNDVIDEKTHLFRQAQEFERRKVYLDKMIEKSHLKKLAVKCIQNDPKTRPNISELVREVLINRPPPPFTNTLEIQLELNTKSQSAQLQAASSPGRRSSATSSSSVASFGSTAASENLIVGYCSPLNHQTTDFQISALQKSESNVVSDGTMEVVVRAPLSMHFTGTLVRTIEGIKSPTDVACNKQNELFVTCEDWKGVLHYDSAGKKLGEYVPSRARFDRSTPGYCYYPRGITVDEDCKFILVDTWNNQIQKFNLTVTPEGRNESFVNSFGELGSGEKELDQPLSAQVNKRNGDVFVCDKNNHRIQIVDKNLTYKASYGKHGDGPSDFLNPQDIDFDSRGNIYVVDCGHYVVKVFSPEWEYLGMIGGEGKGRGTFHTITSICIDRHNYIYVTDKSWNCIQVFNTQKEFVMQVSLPVKQSEPLGLASGPDGSIYVSCKAAGCVYVYK